MNWVIGYLKYYLGIKCLIKFFYLLKLIFRICLRHYSTELKGQNEASSKRDFKNKDNAHCQ